MLWQLPIEWTAQHACGKNQVNGHCAMIIQYMCDDTSPLMRGTFVLFCNRPITDGKTTTTIPNDGTTSQSLTFGQHGTCSIIFVETSETFDYYQQCSTRERNKGLFLADQSLNGNT